MNNFDIPVQVKRRRRQAFTLIEVMIVIVIILAIMGLVGYNLIGSKKKATRDLCEAQMRLIGRSMDQFYITFERYPSSDEGIAVLWSKETLNPDSDQSKWIKFMNEAKPKDPWGGDWVYTAAEDSEGGGGCTIASNGADLQEGTGDDIKVSIGGGDDATGGGDNLTGADDTSDLAPDDPANPG